MNFTFIGSPEAIARQILPWGIGLIIIGLLFIIYVVGKNKALIWIVGGVLLMFAGGMTTWKSRALHSTSGNWNIQVNNESLIWHSPNQAIDPSFSLQLDEIKYVLVESYENMPELKNKYSILTSDETAIVLNPVSGINLEELTQFLESRSIVRKNLVHETAKK